MDVQFIAADSTYPVHKFRHPFCVQATFHVVAGLCQAAQGICRAYSGKACGLFGLIARKYE
jgi:hypothetical protein